MAAKPYNPMKQYGDHAYQFIKKLGSQKNDRLRFLLVHDAVRRNDYYSASSAFTTFPTMRLQKPFYSLESTSSKLKLLTKRNKPVHVLKHNRNGYAVFMEINDRETKTRSFKTARAQFIDVDLNKISYKFPTKRQLHQSINNILTDPTEQISSFSISRDNKGQYRMLAQRSRRRVAALKQSFLARHEDDINDTMIVETKNGYHIYWVLKDGSLSNFVPIQKALAQKFNSDPMITNLSRAMRIPGFYHMKNPESPFMVKVKQWGRDEPFTQEELVQSLALNPVYATKKGNKVSKRRKVSKLRALRRRGRMSRAKVGR
ncbi:DNA-primase RepB domain-containing protein [Paenibacillus sp. MMS18-CY102]|uniref:DNA-primase RepB domain-containing protein n=1 Tax=Paenibacillus sp. MMS18-CY102 TaxID=2682849 RepID=UPI0013652AF5|nr:DNA-primase RepB domain-containing protein [Paenibacillus sp. MMS18-CY102]MWC30759.1 hypothetical protein [Paenibacillus sp. MMS18-CY102]